MKKVCHVPHYNADICIYDFPMTFFFLLMSISELLAISSETGSCSCRFYLFMFFYLIFGWIFVFVIHWMHRQYGIIRWFVFESNKKIFFLFIRLLIVLYVWSYAERPPPHRSKQTENITYMQRSMVALLMLLSISQKKNINLSTWKWKRLATSRKYG